MHSLSTSFVLGYHGCDAKVGERLLRGEAFQSSTNDYDWLGSGVYFWEANPDRALEWAQEVAARQSRTGAEFTPFVVGAVIDLGFCLDLISTNGIIAVEQAYRGLTAAHESVGLPLPRNRGGKDRVIRDLDHAVIEYLHVAREEQGEPELDTVRALFPESTPIYETSGFLRKTHIQVCVRRHRSIKGVFRVPPHHFTAGR